MIVQALTKWCVESFALRRQSASNKNAIRARHPLAPLEQIDGGYHRRLPTIIVERDVDRSH